MPDYWNNLLVTVSLFCISVCVNAQQAEAANTNAQRVTLVALPDTCKAPTYPRLSLRNKEQGEVEIALRVSPSGDLLEARVTTSSGYANLDSAALKAVETCRYTERSDDVVQAVKVKYTFVMDNPKDADRRPQ